MLDRASLDPALDGVNVLVSTAIGYRQGQHAVDDLGNRNLIDAARAANLDRFVFTSILTAEKAPDVSHFWQKKLVEDYLEASGVPFVSLRPGAFIDQPPSDDFWAGGLKKGRFITMGRADVPWTHVHTDGLARYLALVVDEPRAVGQRIDIGCDRPVSMNELADVISAVLDRPIKHWVLPWWLVRPGMSLGGRFDATVKDVRDMFDYFFTGQFVADTSVQAELFDVPTIEDAARRYLEGIGVLSPSLETNNAAA